MRVLFDQHHTPMLRVAAVLVRDHQVAQDVVQDAFMAVYTNWPKIRNQDGAVGYLHRSVVNASRSYLRRRPVAERLARLRQHEQASAEETALKADLPPPLFAAMVALPRREREAVVLRYYLDLPEREAAEAMGLKPGSVKGYASRGLAKLRAVVVSGANTDGEQR
nr:sigma-70 family RNA polymerase sigma factor [Kineosporia babensis]